MNWPTRTQITERHDALQEWRTSLMAIGADMDKLAGMVDPIKRAGQLRRFASTLAADPTTAADPTAAAIQRLARGTEDQQESIAFAAEAARLSADPTARTDQAVSILYDAAKAALDLAWSRLTARRDENVELLREVYLRSAEVIVDLWASIPEGVYNSDHAARHGVADEWETLEAEAEIVTRTRALFCQWFADGIVPNAGARRKNPFSLGSYRPTEFWYADTAAADAALVTLDRRYGPARQASVAAMARALTAGGACLRTIAEVDAIPTQDATPFDADTAEANARAEHAAHEAHRSHVREHATTVSRPLL